MPTNKTYHRDPMYKREVVPAKAQVIQPVIDVQNMPQFVDTGIDLGLSLNEKLIKANSVIAPKEKVAEPAYEKVSEKFGVLRHTDTAAALFDDAVRGIEDLRGELTDEGTLSQHLLAYFDKLHDSQFEDESTVSEYFGHYNSKDKLKALLSYTGNAADESAGEGTGETPVKPSTTPSLNLKHEIVGNASQKLFKTGKVIRQDILSIQNLRSQLVSFRKYQQRKLKKLQSDLAQVEDAIPPAQKRLATLNRERLNELGDYQVVRQLVQENWHDVEQQYAERARVLNNHKGLYFARARETPVSQTPFAPLPLRYSHPDDLVPGCPLEDNDLPSELETFMESVLDIRLSDWQVFSEHLHLLPTRDRLQKWVMKREVKTQYRLQQYQHAGTMVGLQLTRLYRQNQAITRDMARRQIRPAQSLVDFQRSSAEVLSLEELLTGPPHRLRGLAETLRNKLDQASHCLLSQLRGVAPSIRLDWAEAAEADTLNVEQPQQWPGLERAQAADLSQVRTLIDLVNWWFRQLTEQAESASYSAVRNLIRASLMIAAADDPESLVHGHLQTVPPRLDMGAALRVKLNREALPGTLLQIADESSRLIGTLRVDDFDSEGAVATITQLHQADVSPSTRFTVTGLAVPGQRRK